MDSMDTDNTPDPDRRYSAAELADAVERLALAQDDLAAAHAALAAANRRVDAATELEYQAGRDVHRMATHLDVVGTRAMVSAASIDVQAAIGAGEDEGA